MRDGEVEVNLPPQVDHHSTMRKKTNGAIKHQQVLDQCSRTVTTSTVSIWFDFDPIQSTPIRLDFTKLNGETLPPFRLI